MTTRALTGSPLATWYYLTFPEQAERRKREAEGEILAAKAAGIRSMRVFKKESSWENESKLKSETHFNQEGTKARKTEYGAPWASDPNREDIYEYEYFPGTTQLKTQKVTGHFQEKNRRERSTHISVYHYDERGELTLLEATKNGQKLSRKVQEFDGSGHKIRDISYHFDADGNPFPDMLTEILRDKNGNPVREFFWTNDGVTQEKVAAFDRFGNKIQEFVVSPIPGFFQSEGPFNYDEEGTVLRGPFEAFGFSYDGHLWKPHANTFPRHRRTARADAQGRIVEKTFQENVNAKLEYDDHGRLVVDAYWDSPTALGILKVMTWYPDGNLKSILKWDAHMGRNYQVVWAQTGEFGHPKVTTDNPPGTRWYFDFAYDDEGHVREIVMRFVNTTTGELLKTQTETYGPFFRLEKVHEENQSFQQTVETYYDAHGNPIRRELRVGERVYTEWEFVYEYFE